MVRSFIILISVFLLRGIFSEINGTHLRGGYIQARSISQFSLTYRISVIGFTNTDSDIQFGGGVLLANGTEIVGDRGNVLQVDLENGIAFNSFSVDVTFPQPGIYTIAYREENRNKEVINILDSENTSFYIETTIVTDPFLGIVNTGSVSNIIFSAQVGTAYHFMPQVNDIDGDFLQFRFITPLSASNMPTKYTSPIDPSLYQDFNSGNQNGDGPPSFSVNELTGMLVWDAPQMAGNYNLALAMSEYREIDGRYFFSSRTIIDFQLVVDELGQSPRIDFDDFSCLGIDDEFEFKVTSPDTYSIKISPELAVKTLNGDSFNPQGLLGLSGNNSITLTFTNNVVNRPVAIQIGSNDALFERDLTASFGFFLSDNCPGFLNIEGIITAVENDQNIRFCPNPVQNQLYIPDLKGPSDISLFDIEGRLRLEIRGNLLQQIDLSGFTPGVYFITISTPGKIMSGRILKM